MKTNLRSTLLLAATVLLFIPAISFAQGNLTPPGAPAPTMKTLSQIEPRMPIYTIPTNITVSGSYYLTTNLTVSGTYGISINTNDVTIDLEGFTLLGGSSSFNGISCNGTYSNAVIRNGSVKNWGSSGIDLSSGSHNSLDHVNVAGCVNSGIKTGQNDTISYCTSVGNSAIGFVTGYYNMIDHCTASGNGSAGYVLNVENQITDSGAYNNTNVGINLGGVGTLVSRCSCAANALSGIYIFYGNAMVVNNSVIYNNAGANSAHAGIYVGNANCRIEGNHMTGNGYAGLAIASGSTGNIIVRNSASGNSANYILQTGNDVGPVGTAASSTSPWANISN